MLIADHVPFGSAASKLSECFGVEMNLRFARDDKNHAGWDNERLLFSPENGLLADCPITKGRNSSENICSVITFTGQSLTVPKGETAVLQMSDDAYDKVLPIRCIHPAAHEITIGPALGALEQALHIIHCMGVALMGGRSKYGSETK